MLVTAITIENFKGISKPIKIDFKPITLLFGANSSGKSTIVQALHYAREIIERGNIDPGLTILGGSALDLGGFASLVHNRNLDLSISFRFDLDVKNIDLSDFLPNSNDFMEFTYTYEDDINEILNPIETGWIKIELKWDKMANYPIIDVFEIGVSESVFCRFRPDQSHNKIELTFFDTPVLSRIQKKNDHHNFERLEFLGLDIPKSDPEESVAEDEYEDSQSFEYITPHVDMQEDWGDSMDDMEPDFFADDYGREENDDYEEYAEGQEKKRQIERDNVDARSDLPPVDTYQKEIERAGNESEFQQSDKPDPDSNVETVIPLGQSSILSMLREPFVLMGKSGGESEGEDLFFGLMVSSLIGALISSLKESLGKLCYVGPLRELPPRSFEAAKSPDDSRWSTGLAAWDVLHNSELSFVGKVNKWLGSSDHLNSGYTVTVMEYREVPVDNPFMTAVTGGQMLDEDQEGIASLMSLPIKKRVTLKDKYNGIEVFPSEVGIGISQVVPVIVSAVHTRSGIVIIEQPELHIHPAFQVALGDLFIAESQGKDIVFLLETHSEHLMLRLLRRIRETSEGTLPPGRWPLLPESLAVYYLEPGSDGMRVSRLNIDNEGEFQDQWPKGFFDEREEELLY